MILRIPKFSIVLLAFLAHDDRCATAAESLGVATTTTSSNAFAVAPFFSQAEADRARAAHARSLELAGAWRQPTSKKWSPSSVEDLHKNYNKIFKHGNRNAASHLWSTFVLDRAYHLTDEQLQSMFAGFCVVSGSPVRPSDHNRYGLTLPLVPSSSNQWPEGAQAFGYLHYCCWPCVCDTQDFIRVDTKTITVRKQGEDAHEQRQYHFAVLGNPCPRSSQFDVPFKDPFDRGTYTIRQVAAEVRCDMEDQLAGAMLSDNGYVIMGMFFEAEIMEQKEASRAVAGGQSQPQPGRLTKNPATGRVYHGEREFAGMCEDRKNAGYNSGMGEIFRRVASVAPIVVSTGSEDAGGDECRGKGIQDGCRGKMIHAEL